MATVLMTTDPVFCKTVIDEIDLAAGLEDWERIFKSCRQRFAGLRETTVWSLRFSSDASSSTEEKR